ncbi:protein translocase subunit SecD [Streptomyces winkii]|uniref:protein translocase subunit SecD n=1 Tax=Streptomyces winkii TaxID=3051178 RepID=UPI0028D4CC39|nr:protein translocase subunit SecD [Streptomyces sp. DSM 40971]
MTRATKVRAVIALAVMALAAVLAMTKQPRLGIDLRGGTQIVLESRDSETTKATPSATDDTMEVLRQRVDALGVSEPGLVRSGDNRIIVELPGLQDPKEAAEVLGRTAQLTFHPVKGVPDRDERDPATGKNGKESKHGQSTKNGKDGPSTDESGRPVRLGGTAMTGIEVESARASVDPQRGSGWFVDLGFRDKGEDRWADLTGKAACSPAGDPQRRVAIVLDEKVISSPQVDPSVSCGHGITGGNTQITGDFTEGEAKELATLIEGGALPVPVEVIEQHTVGPTLGAEAIKASTWAAVIGVLLTSGFIVCVYRLLGALTAVGLLCYGLIAYAALLAFGATLTLPGLAGFVLAIGMAVDANVLVFERAREEYAYGRGRSLRTASAKGFRGAFGAIVDSNVTTLLAALLLFTLASGPVRGFGVTLSIGVLASMISALVVTRVLVDFTVNRRTVRAHPRITGLAGLGRVRTRLTKRNPDWMRHGRTWLAVSAAAVVLAVGGIVLRGLDFGVEFSGGRLVEYSTSQAVDPEAARSALADAGLPDAVVQGSGGGDGTSGGHEITVRSEQLTDGQEETVRSTLADLGGDTGKVRDELFGPSLGDELRQHALIALGVALGAQLLYLAFRFRWTFGASAVLSLVHDAVILIGAFAWLGKPVDGVFLAALLTVIGYSVNDSVVIFDRVRSEWQGHGKGQGRVHGEPRSSFRSVVNRAVVQTVPRTLNTGMGALFIIAALAVLGGDSLGDFALALLIGISVGSYSSLFVGAPLAVEFEGRTSTPSRPAGRPPRPARVKTRRSPHDNGARV